MPITKPIKYFGGKGNHTDFICSLLPAHRIYIEAFAGSAAVFFAKKPSVVEILNDTDRAVTSLYRILKDKTKFEEFRRLVALAYYSEELSNEAMQTLRKSDEFTDMDLAFALFYRSRTRHGGGLGGFSVNVDTRNGMAKCVWEYLNAVDSLPAIHQRLQNAIVYQRDAFKVVEAWRNDGRNTLLYLDPPYHPETRTSLYRYTRELSAKEHRHLVQLIQDATANVLLHGYDHPDFAELQQHPNWHVIQYESPMASPTKVGCRTETIWMNFKPMQLDLFERAPNDK